MGSVLMLLGAALCKALEGVPRKHYTIKYGTGMSVGLMFNFILGIFATLIFWALNGFRMEWTWYSAFVSLLQGGLGVLYTMIGFHVMKESFAMYALFLMTGGMVVPYLWGLLFLGEPFSAVRLLGVVLIILSAVISRLGSKGMKVGKKQVLLCTAVFLLNGIVCVLSKVHQVETNYPVMSTLGLTVLVNFVKVVCSGIVMLALRKKLDYAPLKGKEKVCWIPIMLSTLAGGTYYVLQLTAASNVSASIMYPMMTGGSVILAALCSFIFFREMPKKQEWAGIALCFAGTLLFL